MRGLPPFAPNDLEIGSAEKALIRCNCAKVDFQKALLQKGGVTRDSRRESSVIAVLHEQADTPDV
ncbi:hypothetical protein, partial [Rubrimonas cliftonensis]|uniref:hypothetical protein n=1 Tax=Rubrimonas cliftonensis TaxID=89524 RepID=UPI001C311F3F